MVAFFAADAVVLLKAAVVYEVGDHVLLFVGTEVRKAAIQGLLVKRCYLALERSIVDERTVVIVARVDAVLLVVVQLLAVDARALFLALLLFLDFLSGERKLGERLELFANELVLADDHHPFVILAIGVVQLAVGRLYDNLIPQASVRYRIGRRLAHARVAHVLGDADQRIDVEQSHRASVLLPFAHLLHNALDHRVVVEGRVVEQHVCVEHLNEIDILVIAQIEQARHDVVSHLHIVQMQLVDVLLPVAASLPFVRHVFVLELNARSTRARQVDEHFARVLFALVEANGRLLCVGR